ncbi:hypothetical protein FB451DRAFT_1233525 [Mycena latifolia]|nr:hypothetical protein FB451DRAFT_1233525 [Mycena latifolia]
MPPSGLNLTLGPIINAAFITVFFFGVITMQTVAYIRNHFHDDVVFLKYFVVFLWLAHLLFAICLCQGAYTMSVSDFGRTFQLLFTPWGLNAAVVIGSLIDHSVQAFFVTRVYRVTGVLYLSIGLWTFVAFLQGVSTRLAVESIRVDSIVLVAQKDSWLISALFFGDASLDIVMASVLCYYLKKQSRSAFKSTAVLISRLIRYTIQTGLATSFVAIGAALSFTFAPTQYIWTAFLISMPGSFTIALLANINSRRNLAKPVSVSTGSHLESGIVINYSRSVVLSRDTSNVDPMKSHEDPETLPAESKVDLGEHRIYGQAV